MAKKKLYLTQREGIYHVRVPVPLEIQKILNKKETPRSLKTKDYSVAIKRRHEVLSVVI